MIFRTSHFRKRGYNSLLVYRERLKRTFGISEQSAKRFLRLTLRIRQPRFCFHQILTFCPPQTDAKAAKRQLGLLLDNLHHRFEMATLYVQERHKKGGIHYHILFLFFDGGALPSPPSHLASTLRSAAFSAWNGQQGDRLVQKANRLFAWAFRPDYFVKQARLSPAGDDGARYENRWWGFRNLSLIKRSTSPVAPADIRAEYIRLFVRPSFALMKRGFRRRGAKRSHSTRCFFDALGTSEATGQHSTLRNRPCNALP